MILQKRAAWTLNQVIEQILWLAALVCALLSLLPGLQGFAAGYGIAGVLFIFALSRDLAAQPPHAADLPVEDILNTRRIGLAAVIGLLVGAILILVIAGLMAGPGASILVFSTLVAGAIILRWRRELNRRILLTGGLIGVIAAAGVIGLGDGDVSWAVLNLICLPWIFSTGALLARRTGLARIRILDGAYRQVLAGFLWGCILAVPAALFNLLGNMQAGDTWVKHLWQPLYAIVPALAEETWARLFLLVLVYALLRPLSMKHPERAVTVAILISTLVWGFGHTGINPIGIVIGSLLYGVPTGLLLIKKDFEHAVGYHFFIDLLRWAAALAAFRSF